MPSTAGSSGSGTGTNANVFTPPGQGNAAAGFWQALQPMLSTGAAGANTVAGMGPPSATAYQNAYPFINSFIAGQGGALPMGAGGAITDAQRAAGYGGGTLFPQTTGASGQLDRAALLGLPDLSKILGNAFSPAYNHIVSATQNNPYAAQATQGAEVGAGMGAQGAGALMSAGQGIMNAGFDPQSALFNRTQGQLLDQSNVANSMAGIGGTPYGASTTANALGNFDINWQNNLLNRESTAAGAASPLFQAAPNLATSSAAMPFQAHGNYLASELGALNARNAAGMQGATGFNALLGGAGGGLTGAANLGAGGANTLAHLGGLPYGTGSTIGSNALSGLSSLAGLGNQAFTGLPQQSISDLMQYMGLGQSASGISGQLGQMGFNQLGAGIGGGLSGLSSLNSLMGGGSGGLFGSSGMFGSGGALGSLFGGGGAAAAGGDAATTDLLTMMAMGAPLGF